MKALSLARALSVFLASVLGVSLAYGGSVLPLPGISGPSLGDPTTNLFSIEGSLQNNTFSNFSSFTTLTVSAANTTSTVLNTGFTLLTAAVGTTGTLMLPTAKPGTNVLVANNTAQIVILYGNGVSPFTPGGIDYVNGFAFSAAAANPYGSAYVVTNGTTVNCFVPQGGNWWCR